KAEVWERGQRNIVGPANTGFEHASAPDGNIALETLVMEGDGFGEPTNPANFNINDPARTERDCLFCVAAVADGFIEANRSFQLPLEFGVVKNVIVPERLLDHQKIEGVKLAKMLEVGRAVG